MTTRRFFINFAPTQNISSTIASGAVSLSVPTFAGWPTQFPFFGALEYGTASAEIVSVTNIAGSVATIVRGQGGTTAVQHLGGATFDMVAVAQDFDEANLHTSSNSGVHGVSGSVVGTSDTQSLSNKTFTGTTALAGVTATTEALTGASTAASYAATGAVSGATVTATGLVQGASVTATGTVTGATVTSSGAINGSSAAITNGITVGATAAVTGAATAASFAANANGTVTGVLTPKSYTNQAAAPAAPVSGTIVNLSAPTGGYPAGAFAYNTAAAAYLPVNAGSIRFKGTTKAATAVTAATNIAYVTIAEDTASGWNSTNKNYVCPIAGTYFYAASAKWSGTPAAAGGISIVQNAAIVTSSPNAPNVAFQGPVISGYLRCAAADTIAAQSTNAYTTQADTGDNNFLELVWLGY